VSLNIEKFIKKLAEAGYKASAKETLITQGWLLVNSRPAQRIPGLLLLGPAGAGKTFFIECLAKALGGTLISYQCHYGTGKEELLYDLDIKGVVEKLSGGKEDASYLRPGVLPQAIQRANENKAERRPVFLLLDEIDKTRPEVDAFLLAFLQSGHIYDPHLGNFILEEEAKLYVCATSNQERLLSEPLMRRFRRVYCKYPPAEVEAEIISRACPEAHPAFVKGLVSVASWLRKRDDIIKPPSTPELINIVRDILLLDDPEARAEIVLSWLTAYEEDRSIIEEKYPRSWWVGMLQDKDIKRGI